MENPDYRDTAIRIVRDCHTMMNKLSRRLQDLEAKAQCDPRYVYVIVDIQRLLSDVIDACELDEPE